MSKLIFILFAILPFQSSLALAQPQADASACRDYIDTFCAGVEDQGPRCLIGFEDKVSSACRKAMRQKTTSLPTSNVLQTAERSVPTKDGQAD
jgi:hypothetical protein